MKKPQTIEEFIDVFGKDIHEETITLFKTYNKRLSHDAYRQFDKKAIIFKEKMLDIYDKEMANLAINDQIDAPNIDEEIIILRNSLIDTIENRIQDIKYTDQFYKKTRDTNSSFNMLLWNLYTIINPIAKSKRYSTFKTIHWFIENTLIEDKNWFPNSLEGELTLEAIKQRVKSIKHKLSSKG